MRKKRIAFCDAQESYILRLEEYIRQIPHLPFVPDVYTDYKKFLECKNELGYDGAVIAECFMKEADSPGILILSEEPGPEEWRLYRYRSADECIKVIRSRFCNGEGEVFSGEPSGKGQPFIGFYSPVKRCLQTTMALGLGQILARRHRVLYLNFEGFSGFGTGFLETDRRAGSAGTGGAAGGGRETADNGLEHIMSGRETLADLVYFYKNMPEDFHAHLDRMKEHYKGVGYVMPVFSYQDILQVSAADWLGMLEEIGAGGRFDYIVLDLNEAVAGIWDILRQCKKVYTCLPEEEAAAAKYRHYEYLLKELEAEDILAKTAIIKITQTAGSDPNADYERNEIIRRLGEEFR